MIEAALINPASSLESDSEGFPLIGKASASNKRKRDELGESKTARKKKKKAKNSIDDGDATLDTGLGINTAIAKFDSRLLADHVAQRTKRFEPDLSLVEQEDKHIPEKAFKDTSEWDKPRTLENMPEYLRQHGLGPKTSAARTNASGKPGSPHTLIVTSAGLRAADATRALRTFQTKDFVVAKLFAKHIKLKHAIEYVKKTKMGIGVGTPSRIVDLLDAGALSSRKLERIVIDASHIDQKKRGILDMKETQQPLMVMLNRAEHKDRYGRAKDGIDLLFY